MTKDDLKAAEEAVYALHLEYGHLAALGETGDAKLTEAFDKLCERFERGAVLLRNIREKNRIPDKALPGDAMRAGAPLHVSGSCEVTDYGFVHIAMNALLPNCRFGAPAYVSDTVTRLLDEYERGGRTLPRFKSAMLIVDEHCDVKSRNVFDQDNKAWKAIPNALKGRLIPDDDQFTLDVALVSEKCDTPSCHIYLLPREDAGDFFWHRQSFA
jgi:hypothetical protein